MKIGILVPSNNKSGPQKMAALLANDLSRLGHDARIYVPILPYFHQFVALGRDPHRWLGLMRRFVPRALQGPAFAFQEVIREGRGRITIERVLSLPSRHRVRGLASLVVMSAAQAHEVRRRYPPARTIYMVHHPEEMTMPTSFREPLRRARQNLRCPMVAVSEATASMLSDHVPRPPFVPNPVSWALWAERHRPEEGQRTSDILFHHSDGPIKGGSGGLDLIGRILRIRPKTRVTVWSREGANVLPGAVHVSHVSEGALVQLYRTHRFLLFPSTFEGFGVPPIEAMACGCVPILRTDVGAAPAFARDTINAVGIDANPDQIASRIAGLLDDEERLGTMRKSGYGSLEAFNPVGYAERFFGAAEIKLTGNNQSRVDEVSSLRDVAS